MPRTSLFILLALACSLLVCPSAACRPLDSALAPDCSRFVSWSVPSALNQSEANLNATLEAQPDGTCPFFHRLDYQCVKYFPKCAGNGTNETVTLLCASYCYTAKTANDRQCGNFNDNYFNLECNSTFYSFSEPCTVLPEEESSDGFAGWKIALVVIACALGLGMLASYGWTRYKECTYNPETDPYIDEVVAKDAAKREGPQPSGYVDLGGAPQPFTSGARQEVSMEEREAAWNASRAHTAAAARTGEAVV